MIAESSMIPSRHSDLNELFETDLPGVLARELVIIHSDKSLLRSGTGQSMLGRGTIGIAERRDICVIFTVMQAITYDVDVYSGGSGITTQRHE